VQLPERSEVVIIGGGVIGTSIAYQLARRGRTDVVLLERTRLTEGSTWHAAGLVGQLRTSSNLTRLMQQSVATYESLEEWTGCSPGWHRAGSLRLASSPQRWTELRRLATAARSFGFDVELISAGEAQQLFPLLNVDGVHGATWVPTDGYVDPNQLTTAFATGARAAGVRIVQGCRVEGFVRAGRRIIAIDTELGRIECDTVVNATGMWGAETARLAGVHVAVGAVEHQYVVTDRSTEIPRDLPTLRDPDARFYLKPETGALVIGGWEDGSRSPWPGGIPRDLGPDLFAPDYDRFAPLADAAAHRIPLLGELGIRTWINGAIPFTPDAEPLIGITEDLDNLFHCCGFSAGIAAAGGAGQAMSNWIVDGDPGLDLWPFDVRRFGAAHNVAAYLEQRSIDAYANYYQIAFPNRELATPRGQRRSPLYDVLRGRGAVPGTKFGWERANWFAPAGVAPVEELTFGRSNAWPQIAREHQAVREGVGIVDLTSFAKYEIAGVGALPLLQQLAAADMDVALGRIVYTQLLNVRGGIEADVTITRLDAERFYLVTGSGFGRHDLAFILGHAPPDGSVAIRDVTSGFGVLGVCGPRAREVVQRISRADFSNAAFRYMTAQRVDLGYAPVLALRVSYVGELGWELHVPIEFMRDLYDRLLDAGEQFGIRDIGYRAINTLRLEKHYLAWATDLKSDNNPYEAGLGSTVGADKPTLLAGPALRRIREQGVSQQLCWFTSKPPPSDDIAMHGSELVTDASGRLAAGVTSAGFGYTLGAFVCCAYVPVDRIAGDDFLVEVAGVRYPARRHERPLYDPSGVRIRS
jgi:glycine cleavage system aminomethyltransferase T/glycine/D-amino acid oxidase-like deaminating enzyme